MQIAMTYLAPTKNGHSGSLGMQSEVRFSSLEDAGTWLQDTVLKHQNARVKVWGNDLQITGATREALFLSADEFNDPQHCVWVRLKIGNGEWQVAHHDISADCYYIAGRSLPYAALGVEIGPSTDH
jgi:hypothetical protein